MENADSKKDALCAMDYGPPSDRSTIHGLGVQEVVEWLDSQFQS